MRSTAARPAAPNRPRSTSRREAFRAGAHRLWLAPKAPSLRGPRGLRPLGNPPVASAHVPPLGSPPGWLGTPAVPFRNPRWAGTRAAPLDILRWAGPLEVRRSARQRPCLEFTAVWAMGRCLGVVVRGGRAWGSCLGSSCLGSCLGGRRAWGSKGAEGPLRGWNGGGASQRRGAHAHDVGPMRTMWGPCARRGAHAHDVGPMRKIRGGEG